MEVNFLHISLLVSFLLLMFALIISLVRLIKGPTIYDRIVSLDLIASVVMGFIILYSLLVNESMYFDIVIVISLISFIGTVSISTYLRLKK